MNHVEIIGERLRRGEFLQARRLAEGVLALEHASAAEKAAAAQLAAEVAYRLDDVQAAIALSRKAAELAVLAGDPDRRGRALFRLCGALAAAGDYTAALETAGAFLEGLADQWPHLEAELAAKLHSNVGMIHRARKRCPEALQAYWQALVRFQAQQNPEGEIHCRQQIAWLLITMEQLPEAAEHLERSGLLLSPEAPGYLAVHQLTAEAMLRLAQAHYPDALALAEEVLAPGRPDVTPANRAVALYVSGMCALHTRQEGVARMMLSLARDAAVASGLSMVMNLVGQLEAAVRGAESAP
jgi:tetratricopeptide (TPR) repeat protein